MSIVEIKFSYFISRNDLTVVVTFQGDINHESIQILERCRNEIHTHLDAAVMVLNFAAIKNITVDAYPLLISLQKAIRDRGVVLKVCDVSNYLTGKLVPQGVFRKSEMAKNLKDALMLARHSMQSNGDFSVKKAA